VSKCHIEHNSHIYLRLYDSDRFESWIAIRYLGGILESYSFWVQEAHYNYLVVTKKLIERIIRLIEDLDVELGTISKEGPCMDIPGIDATASALLNGLRIWDCDMPVRLTTSDSIRTDFKRLVELVCQ
jgi:hypothetical protein